MTIALCSIHVAKIYGFVEPTEDESLNDSDNSGVTDTGIIILVPVPFTSNKLCVEVTYLGNKSSAGKHVSVASGKYVLYLTQCLNQWCTHCQL